MKKFTKMVTCLFVAMILSITSTGAFAAVTTTQNVLKEGWNATSMNNICYVENGSKIRGWKQILKSESYNKIVFKDMNYDWYYFDENGNMKTGWIQDGGDWYYLYSYGAMAIDDWVDQGKYYVNGDGIYDSAQTYHFTPIGGKWVYTDSKQAEDLDGDRRFLTDEEFKTLKQNNIIEVTVRYDTLTQLGKKISTLCYYLKYNKDV